MRYKWHAIDEETVEVLKRSEVTGREVVLPENLHSDLYAKVKRVLTALGAVWDRSKNAHVAEYDLSAELDNAINNGRYHDWKKDSDFFFTPDLVHEYFDCFNPYDESYELTVLDPSAGRGHLMRYIKKTMPRAKVYAVEINPLHMPYLEQAGYEKIHLGDFMEYQPPTDFDLVLMNPPFQNSLEHIMRAYTMLKPGGSLISIAEGGLTFRKDGKYKRWTEFVKDKYYEIMRLPAKAFADSGTTSQTVILGLTKFDTTVQHYTYYQRTGFSGEIVEITNVPDELYGVTVICVDVAGFLKGCRVFPCASGNDFRLTEKMEREVFNLVAGKQDPINQMAA